MAGPGQRLLLLLPLLLGRPLEVAGTEATLSSHHAPNFLLQAKRECHFANGTAGQVRYVSRDTYDRQDCLHFDSRLGRYVAASPLCQPEADGFNRDPQWLAYQKARVEAFCRYNYGVITEYVFRGRTVQPTVSISPTKTDPLAHHTLLLCTAAGYYPQEATIKWLKNGQEETEGVGYAEEIQNGDWTFHYQALLETLPQRGDIYACQVEHSSLTEPVTVLWEPQTLDSAKSKLWTGAVGVMLGVAFVAVGLYLYLKDRKATPLPPSPALIG